MEVQSVVIGLAQTEWQQYEGSRILRGGEWPEDSRAAYSVTARPR